MLWPTFDGKQSMERMKSMNTSKQAQQPTLAALVAYRLSGVFALLKPKYTAVEISAAIARSGNPAGA